MNKISALFTDFYELTMAQGYWKEKMNQPAVFDMFFRRQPFGGGFSVFAGIEPIINYLIDFKFSSDDIAYLETLNLFEPAFLKYLETFKFSGDLYALREGTIIFPHEPLLRIHAGLIEAQIIEGLILNTINFQSLIATKTARIWLASKKSTLMEFGLRRAQGYDGAMSASRAAFIGGANGTSNVLAGKQFDIPVMGTMAHSWIMSFASETEAFRAYAKLYPDNAIFLIDTYNSLHSGLPHAITIGKELLHKGKNFGVRLDSGDMHYLSTKVRKALDEANLPNAFITVSNELSEEIIETLVAQGAPINAWGVGTNMVTGGSDSSFTGVYKLCARANKTGNELIPSMKFSDNPEKTTNPGVKNLWRLYDADGMFKADIMAQENEIIEANKNQTFYHPTVDYRQFTFSPSKTEQLLEKRIVNGMLTRPAKNEKETLKESRRHFQNQLEYLDITYRRILNPHIYKVSISEALKNIKLDFIRKHLS